MEDYSRFIQGAEGIKVFRNEDMVCRNCRYLIEDDTAACDIYKIKPVSVMEGRSCREFARK
ncbi:MAG: hypothetical protein KH452_12900 [Clostridiales bacterium]|nr:hypothetical protein [Clostridiales bacterium]